MGIHEEAASRPTQQIAEVAAKTQRKFTDPTRENAQTRAANQKINCDSGHDELLELYLSQGE